jgi:hypothetical protein
MTTSGMPFAKSTTSGLMCFFAPFTSYWRVTTSSLFSGVSKSMKRTEWLFFPSPRSCSSEIPYVSTVWTFSLASMSDVAGPCMTARTAF